MNEIKLLKKLITFDSQCTKSNRTIAFFIASLFPKKICRINKLKKGDLDLYNVTLRFPGQNSSHPLIFSGHTDTVPLSSRWTINPFKGEIKNGKIFGLGASDMKAGLTSLISAALSIKEKLPQDIYFLFDADEEDGCAGGYAFLKTIKIKPDPAQVIIAEPTGGNLIIGQKGAMDIQISFTGQSFHASKTSAAKNEKLNAINKAAGAINELHKLEKQWEKNPDPLFGPSTQAVCKIEGGIAGNVIPDSCKISINRRFLPMENPKKILEQIKKIINKFDPRAKIETSFIGEANLLSKNSPLLRNARNISQKILRKNRVIVAPYWTQAGNFKRWGDCLIWGPGEAKMAHQANEYCPIRQVKKMTKCYQTLIKQTNEGLKKSKKGSVPGSRS